MHVLPDRGLAELEALYRARHAHFVRVARAITGDPERAHEAVQDAFADAIRSRRTFRGDAPLEAWVWRGVINAARKAIRRPLVEVGAANDDLAPPPVARELAPAVAALPERQRLVVFLRYYADLDYRTIAAALDVEVGTVSATLAAAHRAVKQKLEEVQADA
jgi:DNA-directed RNA polymerase specialized sigma24 family protein